MEGKAVYSEKEMVRYAEGSPILDITEMLKHTVNFDAVIKNLSTACQPLPPGAEEDEGP